MSGSLSYLTSLFTASFGAGDSILDAVYGIGSTASTQNPVQALAEAESNETQDLKITAAQPTVQHAITAFTNAVNSAKSVTQLLSNPAVMNVLLTANNMSDQIGYTALATQALTSDLSNPNSLANQLTDTRWKTLAATYNFAANGLQAIQKSGGDQPRSPQLTRKRRGRKTKTRSHPDCPMHWPLRRRRQPSPRSTRSSATPLSAPW